MEAATVVSLVRSGSADTPGSSDRFVCFEGGVVGQASRNVGEKKQKQKNHLLNYLMGLVAIESRGHINIYRYRRCMGENLN